MPVKDRSEYEFGRQGDLDFLKDALATNEAFMKATKKPFPDICEEFESGVEHMMFFFDFLAGDIAMRDATALSNESWKGAELAKKYLAWMEAFQADPRATADEAARATAKELMETTFLLWWKWHSLSNQIFEAAAENKALDGKALRPQCPVHNPKCKGPDDDDDKGDEKSGIPVPVTINLHD